MGSLYIWDFIVNLTELNKDYSLSVLFVINILLDFLILRVFKVFSTKMALLVIAEVTVVILSLFFFIMYKFSGIFG